MQTKIKGFEGLADMLTQRSLASTNEPSAACDAPAGTVTPLFTGRVSTQEAKKSRVESKPPAKKAETPPAATPVAAEKVGHFEKVVMMGDVEAGVIGVDVIGYHVDGLRHFGGRTSFVEVHGISSKVSEIELEFYLNPKEDIECFRYCPNADVLVGVGPGEITTVKASVEWIRDEKSGMINPHIANGKNKTAIFFRNNENGEFRHASLFLALRSRGHWYVGVEVMVAGKLSAALEADNPTQDEARTLTVGGSDYVVRVNPMSQANAYPGFDYFLSFPKEGEAYVRQTIADRRHASFADRGVPTWSFPKHTSLPKDAIKSGYALGVCKYWDTQAGMGKVLLKDGRDVFCYFTKCVSQSPAMLMSLLPGEHVGVKYEEGDKGLRARAFRTL